MPLIQWILQDLSVSHQTILTVGSNISANAEVNHHGIIEIISETTISLTARVDHNAESLIESDSEVTATGTIVSIPTILAAGSNFTATAEVIHNATVEITTDSEIEANATVISPIPPIPPVQPVPIQREFNLGVTYGPPGGGGGGVGVRKKKKSIIIKFTFAGNIYNYEQESGESIVIMKGLSKKQPLNSIRPQIKLETLRNINGKNYNLQEQR